jgi:glycosyltransferase involved in cell wall biosynthesis
MDDRVGQPPLDVAYVHYGAQSGVTQQVAAALRARGHLVRPVSAVGELEPRDPVTGNRRITAQVLAHLATAALRYGRRGVAHRWNTPYAFDAHSERARRLLEALSPPPRIVLQNGALFAPGIPPPLPYVLLLDHTCALAAEMGDAPGLPPVPDYGPQWRTREAAVYAGARAICTLSHRTADSVRRHYGIDAARVHVVGAGANVFPERPARMDDGRTILFVGKDFVRKGGPVLLEAFRLVRRRHPKARLLLAGPREPIEGLPPGAVQLGPVPFAELADVFALATVFALPTPREPFGLAFLDAMACGVPCVGTRTGAVPEIVADGATGQLVAPGDAPALAAALSALLADLPRARAMGEAGRIEVARRFRWEQVAARLERALSGAVSRPAGVAA